MSKVPATVITGFLGAGKTTIIRHILQNANGRRLALIINEFGDVGIDGELVKGCNEAACSEEDIIELANGCICCTVADEFLPTMEKLLNRPDPPEHIIIETSGLALPKPLIKAFQWPDIRTRATVDGVIAIIDAEAVYSGRFVTDQAALNAAREADPNLEHDNPLEELFEDQLGCADLVILNKTDLVEASQIPHLEDIISSEIRQGVKSIRAKNGEIDINILLGLSANAEDDLETRHSHHDNDADHDHDDFDSFVLKGNQVKDLNQFIEKISNLIATNDILRVKGMIALENKPSRLILQAVGARIQHHYDRKWNDGENRITQLVFIGQKGLNQSLITSELETFLA